MPTTCPAATPTCSDLIGRIEGDLPLALVGTTARRRLHRTAASIPAAVVSSVWLECRLARATEQVDLSVKVQPASFTHLAGREAPSVPFEAAAAPLWARVRSLARRWMGGNTPIRDGATGIWLEHDAVDPSPADAAGVPAPGVFVQLARTADGTDGVERWTDLVADALGSLLGRPAPRALLAHLRACFLATPPGARALQLGVMLSRDPHSVRLCFVFADPANVPLFLRRVGHRHRAEVAALLHPARYGASGPLFAGSMMVHLDVSEAGVLPTIGVDYQMEARPQLRGRLREQGFLDDLVHAGLADATKVDALRGWPGARYARIPSSPRVQALVRRVSHLKLTYRPGCDPEAKAYLTFFTAGLFDHPTGN